MSLSVSSSEMALGWERGWTPPARTSTVGLQLRFGSGVFADGSQVGGMQFSSGLPREFKALARKMPVFVNGVTEAVAQKAAWCWGLQHWDSLLAKPVQSLSAVNDVLMASPWLRERPLSQERSRKPPAWLAQPAAMQPRAPRQLHGVCEVLPVVFNVC